jgi:hypothetical protein
MIFWGLGFGWLSGVKGQLGRGRQMWGRRKCAFKHTHSLSVWREYVTPAIFGVTETKECVI